MFLDKMAAGSWSFSILDVPDNIQCWESVSQCDGNNRPRQPCHKEPAGKIINELDVLLERIEDALSPEDEPTLVAPEENDQVNELVRQVEQLLGHSEVLPDHESRCQEEAICHEQTFMHIASKYNTQQNCHATDVTHEAYSLATLDYFKRHKLN